MSPKLIDVVDPIYFEVRNWIDEYLYRKEFGLTEEEFRKESIGSVQRNSYIMRAIKEQEALNNKNIKNG